MFVRLLLALLFALPLSAATFPSHDGTMLHYDVVGTGDPVILLSGGPGFSPDYLRPVAEEIGKGRMAVLFHQRGTGKSASEKIAGDSLALPNLVEDLESLRKELKVEKLTLVGHSFGGILSMMYARTHPERVTALALIDSGGPTLASVAKFTANLESRFTDEDRALIKEWSDPAKVKSERKRAVLELTRAKTPAYFADRAKAKPLVDSLDDTSFNDGVFWAVVMQMTALDLRSGLEKVSAPVLVVHGRQDPLESAEEVHAAFPQSKLVMIEDAGHFPWIEQPEAVYGPLREFLAVGERLPDCH